jgi:hypothetical protein
MKTFSSLSLYLFATVNINKIQNLAFGVHVLPGKIERKKTFFSQLLLFNLRPDHCLWIFG